jgi:F0F1-type ATP synthase epsilon subunit
MNSQLPASGAQLRFVAMQASTGFIGVVNDRSPLVAVALLTGEDIP